MNDIEAKFCKAGCLVLLITEAFKDGPLYVLSVENGPTKTRDTFKSFDDAFDSFSSIVKTLTKEV